MNRDSSRISRFAVWPLIGMDAQDRGRQRMLPGLLSCTAPPIARSTVSGHSMGWVRFKIRPASGIPSAESRSTKNVASRSASGSAADTTTNRVPRRLSSS